MILEDGTGTGKKAGITNTNLLRVLSYNLEFEHYANHTLNSAYSVVFNQTPDDNGTFLYLKNTDDDDLSVSAITIYCDTTGIVEVRLGQTGTPVNGTDLTPTNRTSGTADTAECDCESGNNITGLSGGNLIDRIFCLGTYGSKKYAWRSGLLLPKNTTLTLNTQENSPVEIWGTLSIYFHDHDDE